MTASTAVTVALTPPEPWMPERRNYVPGSTPDPLAIYRAMEAEGVNVTLIDPNPKPWNPLFGMHPIYMGLDPWRALAVLLARRKVDLVLSIFEASCLLPLLLRRPLAFGPRIAMWDIVPTLEWRARKTMQNIVVPRVDHIFLLSEGQRPVLEKRWRAGGKTTVVHQHIDADFFAPVDRQPVGYALAIGDDIGRDYDTLMQALHDLDVDVVAKTRRALKRPPGFAARVEQLSKRLPFLELKSLYADAAFVVVPLHITENVSGVGSVLEAMAMGKALIVSDTPTIRDYVVAGETALVVRPHDPRDLRDAIAALSADPQRAAWLGHNGRRFVEAKFANPVFGKRLAKSIRQVTGHS